MLRNLCSILTLALTVTGVAQAQTPTKESPSAFWNDKIIKIDYSGWGLQLQVNNISSSIPFIKPEIRSLLEEFPDSKSSLKGFDDKYVSGQIFLWCGLTVALVGVAIGANQTNSSSPQPAVVGTSLGLAIGGLCVELWGAFTIVGSYRDLFDGVNEYNKDQFAAYSTN